MQKGFMKIVQKCYNQETDGQTGIKEKNNTMKMSKKKTEKYCKMINKINKQKYRINR